MPQVAFLQAKKKAKGKEQSNLAAFNIKSKYPPHADDALVRAKVCSTVCALSAATCNRSSALFILLGVQKLAHVRTLDKMTTAACQVFFQEVDGIELQDLKKLKTLNFDR